MNIFYIEKSCREFRCHYEEQDKIHYTDSWDGAREIVKELEEKDEKCPLCGKSLRYHIEKEMVMTKEVIEKINEIEEMLKEFVSDKPNLMVKHPTQNMLGEIKDSKVWAVITKEEEKYFDHYDNVFGDVFTIFFEDDELWIWMGTNYFNKKVFYGLINKYGESKPSWSYDQLSAPEWTIDYHFKKVEELGNFLKDIWELTEKHPRSWEEISKNPMEYVVSIKENENEENYFYFVEKEDWEHFHDYIYEHYHQDLKQVMEMAESLELKKPYDNRFETNLSKEAILEKLNDFPLFRYNKEFQEHMEQYERQMKKAQEEYNNRRGY